MEQSLKKAAGHQYVEPTKAMDTLTPEQRRRAMASVKSENTAPELLVRRILHANGFRFRLHRKDLPGKPDIVLPKYRTVIFVHGCFWHQHTGCPHASRPSSNQDYWQPKLDRNIERDAKRQAALRALGWRVIVVWECNTKNLPKIATELKQLLTARHQAACIQL